MQMRLRQICVAAAVAATVPLTAFAQPTHAVGAVEGTFYGCMDGVIAQDDRYQTLSTLGWNRTARADLSETNIDALAAKSLLNHVVNTPVSPRWENTWETVRKTASGERRKVDVEDALPATEFYTRADDASLLIVSVDGPASQSSIACEIILTADLDAEFREMVGDPELYPTPVYAYERQSVGPGSIQIIGYDRSRIEPAVEQEFPFIAYMQMVP